MAKKKAELYDAEAYDGRLSKFVRHGDGPYHILDAPASVAQDRLVTLCGSEPPFEASDLVEVAGTHVALGHPAGEPVCLDCVTAKEAILEGIVAARKKAYDDAQEEKAKADIKALEAKEKAKVDEDEKPKSKKGKKGGK